MVRDAIRTALATTEARIDVEIITDLEVPAVPLDARLVRQAVLNIALNAVLSMEGAGKLDIRISSVQLGGAAHARVEIINNGPGIAAEVLPRVFEPFFTARPKGTGLGLAVVKRIVEGHRGRVSVVSEPGKGTAFVIDLPAERGVNGAALSLGPCTARRAGRRTRCAPGRSSHGVAREARGGARQGSVAEARAVTATYTRR